jgi:hypothetical protein
VKKAAAAVKKAAVKKAAVKKAAAWAAAKAENKDNNW